MSAGTWHMFKRLHDMSGRLILCEYLINTVKDVLAGAGPQREAGIIISPSAK